MVTTVINPWAKDKEITLELREADIRKYLSINTNQHTLQITNSNISIHESYRGTFL